MESKKKVACDAPSSSSIYVIKVNIVPHDNIWVYDTSCGSYIWIDMQGLRSSRKLTKGESNFRMHNGARLTVSHPDSKSDSIGGSEPSSGRETIYWDSIPIFLFFSNENIIYKNTE